MLPRAPRNVSLVEQGKDAENGSIMGLAIYEFKISNWESS
jgi:hypothetical protein